MKRLRAGIGMALWIGITLLVLVLAISNCGSSQTGEGDHVISETVIWKDRTVMVDSIEVKESGTLIIEDSLIIVNNTGPSPTIYIFGTLIMNSSTMMPRDHEAEERYYFKVYGNCILNDNEFIRVNSLAFFTSEISLSGNTIRRTKADGIFLNGDLDSENTPIIDGNTIIDSELYGIRLLDAEAEFRNNQIQRTNLDGFHITSSIVSLTNTEFSEVGRHRITVAKNSTLDLHAISNFTKSFVWFQDDSSVVRYHNADGVTTIEPDESSSRDYMSLAILLGFIAIICLGGVNLFYQMNRDKVVKGKYSPQDLSVRGDTREGFELPDGVDPSTVENQVAFGDMAMSGGQYEAALKYYLEAMTSIRSDDILVRKGNTLEKMQRYQEAYDSYEAAYKINGNNKDAIEGMWWLKDLIRTNEAVQDEIAEKVYEFIREPDAAPPKEIEQALEDAKKEKLEDAKRAALEDAETDTTDDDIGEGGSEGDEESQIQHPGIGNNSDNTAGDLLSDSSEDDLDIDGDEPDEEITPIKIIEKAPQPPSQGSGQQPPPRVDPAIPPEPSQKPPQDQIPSELSESFKGLGQRPRTEGDEQIPFSRGGPFSSGPERTLHLDEQLSMGQPDSKDDTQADDPENDETSDGDETNKEDEAGESDQEEEEIIPRLYEEFSDDLRIPLLQMNIETVLKELDIKRLYFEDKDILLRQIATALANGKHIIFYGPPGTGKSAIAREICECYGVDFSLVTGTSDWSTFDTIGGYMLEDNGDLRFSTGLFLRSHQDYGVPINRWLIIDEINRADIDKAFGPMFSALAGDSVVIPQKIEGKYIEIEGKPKDHHIVEPHRFFIHPEWHILATMNTFDKSSLYEMSYAFMRRFSFIGVQIPEDLDLAVKGLVEVWNMDVDKKTMEKTTILWKIINDYRKIGPAILEDILKCVLATNDYTSAITMYVIPQFEGLEDRKLRRFMDTVLQKLSDVVDVNLLKISFEDFFNMGS